MNGEMTSSKNKKPRRTRSRRRNISAKPVKKFGITAPEEDRNLKCSLDIAQHQVTLEALKAEVLDHSVKIAKAKTSTSK